MRYKCTSRDVLVTHSWWTIFHIYVTSSFFYESSHLSLCLAVICFVSLYFTLLIIFLFVYKYLFIYLIKIYFHTKRSFRIKNDLYVSGSWEQSKCLVRALMLLPSIWLGFKSDAICRLSLLLILSL